MKKASARSRVANNSKKPSFRLQKWMIVVGIIVVALVGIVVVRLSFASTGSEIFSGVQSDFQRRVTKPVGALTAITACSLNKNTNAKTGTADGWAIDRSKPNTPTTVDLAIDGKKFSTTTNKPSPASVNSLYPNFGSNNGFSYALPAEYYDGKKHTLVASALGNQTVAIGTLDFTCSVVNPNGTTTGTTSTSTTTTTTANSTTTTTAPVRPNTTTAPIGSTGLVVSNPALSTAAKQTVASVVSQLVRTNSSATKPSGSTQSSNSSSSSAPTTLATVNLLNPSQKLSSEEIVEINKQIDALPTKDLVTISSITPFNPNITEKNVTLVGYYLDKKLVYYSETAPFSFDFDTTRFENGSYRLDVVGYDSNNTQVVSQVAKFNIENHLSVLQQLSNAITYPIYLITQKK